MNDHDDSLNDIDRRLFASYMALRVLGYWEQQHEDTRPRRCVEVAQQFAIGRASAEDMQAVRADAYAAYDSKAAYHDGSFDAVLASVACAEPQVDLDYVRNKSQIAAASATGTEASEVSVSPWWFAELAAEKAWQDELLSVFINRIGGVWWLDTWTPGNCVPMWGTRSAGPNA